MIHGVVNKSSEIESNMLRICHTHASPLLSEEEKKRGSPGDKRAKARSTPDQPHSETALASKGNESHGKATDYSLGCEPQGQHWQRFSPL